jgi:predicted Zn-dependent protease
MGQEVSVSYQAVKSRVYRLIDSLVEGDKNEQDVQESMKRWWKLVHPADRPMAKKYLMTVLQKSNATLGAITDGLGDVKDFSVVNDMDPERPSKMRAVAGHSQASAM